MNENDLMNMWKNSRESIGEIEMEAVKRRSRVLEKKVKFRNFLEYGAGIYIMYAFIKMGIMAESLIRQLACFEIALAGLFICIFIYIKGSYEKIEDIAIPSRKYIELHREALKRQIKLLSNVRYWYVLPLMSGMFVLQIDAMLGSGNLYFHLGFLLFSIALGIFIIYLNEYKAVAKLRKELDALPEIEI